MVTDVPIKRDYVREWSLHGAGFRIAIVSQSFQDYKVTNRFHLIVKHIIKTVQHYHIPLDGIPLTPYENEKSIRMECIRSGIPLNPEKESDY